MGKGGVFFLFCSALMHPAESPVQLPNMEGRGGESKSWKTWLERDHVRPYGFSVQGERYLGALELRFSKGLAGMIRAILAPQGDVAEMSSSKPVIMTRFPFPEPLTSFQKNLPNEDWVTQDVEVAFSGKPHCFTSILSGTHGKTAASPERRANRRSIFCKSPPPRQIGQCVF